jgi:hypothetical protein
VSSRYVQLPNGSYLEWPEGVSAATFKAKATKLGLAPKAEETPNRVNESMGKIEGISAYHPKTGLVGVEEQMEDARQRLRRFAGTGVMPTAIGDLMASVPLGGMKVNESLVRLLEGKPWKATKDAVGGTLEALQLPSMFIAPEVSGAVKGLLPSTAKAGKLLEAVEQVAGHVPVDLNSPTKAAIEIVQNAKSGGSRPKVIADFVRRISDQKQPPLTYAEARKFYENAISKFAPDIQGNPLKGKPRYMLGKFAKSLDQAIQGAAKQAGVEDQYIKAMKAYHNAAQFESAGRKVGKKVKQGVGLAAAGAATAMGAKAGYNWLKK